MLPTESVALWTARLTRIPQARQLVLRSDGLEQTRILAQAYADTAAKAISAFPNSEAKRGLEEMCVTVMKRRK